MARPSTATREDDEKRLLMLAMRDRGRSSTQIGATVGMTSAGVRATLRKMDREYAASEGAA